MYTLRSNGTGAGDGEPELAELESKRSVVKAQDGIPQVATARSFLTRPGGRLRDLQHLCEEDGD